MSLEKILHISGGIEIFVGGVMQAYPELIPHGYGQYVGWFMMGIGIISILVGFFVRSKKGKAGFVDKSKSLINQGISVAGDNTGTIAPTYNTELNIGVDPKLELMGTPSTQERTDGTMETSFLVRMTAPASLLTIQAQGDNLLDMRISRPPRGDGVSTTAKTDVRKVRSDNTITESFSNPSGTYEIKITTSDDTMPKIAHEVEP